MEAEKVIAKLSGEPLTIDRLLEALPFLNEILAAKELTRAQLENTARGGAVLRRFRAGDVVCAEGDFGSTAFFILSGRVEVTIDNPFAQLRTRRAGGGVLRRGVARLKRMTSFLVRDADAPRDPESKQFIPVDASVDLPRDRPIAELEAGEIFGEMTCRTFQPRSATVTALEDCTMVEMLRVILDLLSGTRAVSEEHKKTAKLTKYATFKGSPTFRKMVEDKYRERSLVQHLRSVPMFAGLGVAFLEELKLNAQLVSHAAGDDIVTQGEDADAFYLIRTGMVKVVQQMPGGEMVRTYLSRGDFFGEVGLIQPDGKRIATCRALDMTDVVRIQRSLFEQMLERYPEVRVQVRLIADARLRSAISRNLPTGLDMDEFLDQGLFEAQNLLLIDLDKCTRCDACVTACAEAHDGVTRLLRDGLRYDRYLVATACRSCHDPLCMTQCPVGSIRRKESLEIQIESWCIGCSKCAELCPYGNINMHPFEMPEKPVKAAAPPPPKAIAPAPAPVAAEPKGEKAPAVSPPAPVVAAKQPSPVAAPKKKTTTLKATTCDLCTDLVTPSCVYACPHDAAMRVDPGRYFAGQSSAQDRRRRSFLSRLFFKSEPDNRTTH